MPDKNCVFRAQSKSVSNELEELWRNAKRRKESDGQRASMCARNRFLGQQWKKLFEDLRSALVVLGTLD